MKILFLSESCLLDPRSGAARTVATMLRVLAAAGHEARSCTLGCFDGDPGAARAAARAALGCERPGRVLRRVREGVEHRVLVPTTPASSALQAWELRRYAALVQEELVRDLPDLILLYGGAPPSQALADARRCGVRVVFYVANPSYAQRPSRLFEHCDAFIVPSEAAARRYAPVLPRRPRVLRSLVDAPFEGRRNLTADRIAGRRDRAVTMINPEPAKGGLVFLNMVAQARRHAPELRFRAVEGRWPLARWQRAGIDPSTLARLEWLPPRDDLSAVFADASLLLVPSLWFEMAGRVVAEALLAGVPVVAHRRGALVEQGAGTGVFIDPPDALVAQPQRTPERDFVLRWLRTVRALLGDEAVYARAVREALAASRIYQPEARDARVLELFEALRREPPSTARGAAGDAQAGAAPDAEEDADAVPLLAFRDAPGDDEAGEPEAVLARADALFQDGAVEDAQRCFRRAFSLLARRRPPGGLARALHRGDLEAARTLLEARLADAPEDPLTLVMAAEFHRRDKAPQRALACSQRLADRLPGFLANRVSHVRDLLAARQLEAVFRELGYLERLNHDPVQVKALRAFALTLSGRHEDAIAAFEAIPEEVRTAGDGLLQYGNALRYGGRAAASVPVYRRATERRRGFGAAWWSLANLKTAALDAADVERMERLLEGADGDERMHLHFALGTACEQAGEDDRAFAHYARANALRAATIAYDPEVLTHAVDAWAALLDGAHGPLRTAPEDDGGPVPIFVLGLPRVGSTLVEQILASHAQVEATRELPCLPRVARLCADASSGVPGLVAALAKLSARDLQGLGECYLSLAARERSTDRRWFVDKLPSNWQSVVLIRMILPRARIVDVRRAPMPSGFAAFKQHFPGGHEFSYDLEHIGRYYRDYVRKLEHVDRVLPGVVHRVRYEALVEDTERTVRALLDACGLPFDPACLRAHRTSRAVATPSSEQVARPIYRDALEHWRRFERHLAPLRRSLGDLAEHGPEPAPAPGRHLPEQPEGAVLPAQAVTSSACAE